MSAATLHALQKAVDERLGEQPGRACNRRERRQVDQLRRSHVKGAYSAQRREAFRTMLGQNIDELDPELRAAILEDRIAPLAGGATGKGAAAFFVNQPPQGTFDADVDYFNQETERNDVPQAAVAYTGLGGSRMDQRISNVGILSNIRLLFIGSLVVAGGGTCTSTYQWPWNVAKRVTLQANGQTSLIQCEGLDLRARRQRMYRNPREDLCTAPATDTVSPAAGVVPVGNPVPGVIANGTYTVVLMYDLPIVHDNTTLTGALFAQSDSNYLNWTIEPALTADLFTLTGGSTATLTGTFWPMSTFFDLPYTDTQQGRMVATPDMTWLHGYIASNQPFSNTGDVKAPFIKNAGQLIAYYVYLDNGGAAQIDPVTGCDELRVEYGGNRRPRVYGGPVASAAGGGGLQLLEENERNYNGRMRPGYMVLDFEGDNPDRDLVYPRGVSELQFVAKVNAGVGVNANARVHFVEETLFSGV